MSDATSSRVPDLVNALTLDEKAALTAGVDMWTTARCPASASPPCGSPTGPTGRWAPDGARGPAAACLPCGSALGATWDPALVGGVGAPSGREARAKGAGSCSARP